MRIADQFGVVCERCGFGNIHALRDDLITTNSPRRDLFPPITSISIEVTVKPTAELRSNINRLCCLPMEGGQSEFRRNLRRVP
jgi:hypothetical protein